MYRQASDLHTSMMRALPNAARLGFSGTPIIMDDKKCTHDIFDEYIAELEWVLPNPLRGHSFNPPHS
ncbi:hypothetical protein [Roseovarius sp.]|uniref:hypothetical protein n=1 Tax=Roseovarius sp. TaxID=1486281 RepID=UPI003569B873